MTQDQVRNWFRGFADRECKGYSEHYYRLAHAAADDDGIMAFVSDRPDPQPNLFFASIQFLTGPENMPHDAASLLSFVNGRRDELIAVMESHHTQTNEIGRCAVLLPAMPPGPLAVVEVGASAGLCLLMDRCSYDYGNFQFGDPSSPVHLRCVLSGTPITELRMPNIVWRHGIDIAPVDLHDENQMRWLRSCIWPDHQERRQRFDGAVDLWRRNPPPLSRGDLVDEFAQVAARAPSDATLVVFHSAVLVYLSPERRRAFVEALNKFSFARPIVWISNEERGVIDAIAAIAPAESGTVNTRGVVGRTTLRNGVMQSSVVGIAQAHGAELEARASAGYATTS